MHGPARSHARRGDLSPETLNLERFNRSPRVFFIALKKTTSGFTKLRPVIAEGIVVTHGATSNFISRQRSETREFFIKVACFCLRIFAWYKTTKSSAGRRSCSAAGRSRRAGTVQVAQTGR
jgi:hypothetical protein